MSTEPYISPNIYFGISPIHCLICDKVISKNDKSAELTAKNWLTFKANAERWSKMNIPLEDENHTFTECAFKNCQFTECIKYCQFRVHLELFTMDAE